MNFIAQLANLLDEQARARRLLLKRLRAWREGSTPGGPFYFDCRSSARLPLIGSFLRTQASGRLDFDLLGGLLRLRGLRQRHLKHTVLEARLDLVGFDI